VAVDPLSSTFAALADPTRRAILERLAQGEATVNELAEPFPITVQAISQHLKVLEHAAAWLERYRPFWEGSFDRLEARLRATKEKPEHG
jgi:DNA-binding transcriptional ArsR family regulator